MEESPSNINECDEEDDSGLREWQIQKFIQY